VQAVFVEPDDLWQVTWRIYRAQPWFESDLDQAGEAALAQAIETLKRSGVALIIVGHRPSTLSVATKILFLKEGRTAMFGERDQVLEALKERSPEPLPQGDGRRRLSSGNGSTNGLDGNAKAMAGAR